MFVPSVALAGEFLESDRVGFSDSAGLGDSAVQVRRVEGLFQNGARAEESAVAE